MKHKPPLITITLIFLTVLLGIVSGPLGSAVEVPAALKPYAFPLFLVLAIILSIIAVWQYFLQEKTEERIEPPALLAIPRNRQIIIARVRAKWITDGLEQSLHGAALIALGLRDQPDVLANPLRLALEEKDQSAQMLPAGTRITQVYDKAPSGLLILGEPGSGKTTMLLELARDLLSRAETDNSYPLPMVFDLSSWAVKRQPLAEWFVEEMKTMHEVSRRLGQAWVQADQVLPLLDGLDEVAPPYRAACVDAINAFREEHGLVNLVVCSRHDDYLRLKQHVLMKSAVVVQPLTEQQIDAYLASAGEQLEAVRVALRSDPVLQELATTPLVLSILSLTYQGQSSKALEASGSLEARRHRLWDDYVQTMLQRRRALPRYTPQQTIVWLTWLAKQLQVHNQTEFYLERIQPDWLPERWSPRLYRGLVGGLIGGMVGGLPSGFVGGLLVWLQLPTLPGWILTLVSSLLIGLLGGLVGVLIVGLPVGLLVGLLSRRMTEIHPVEVVVWSWASLWQGFFEALVIGLLSGALGIVSSELLNNIIAVALAWLGGGVVGGLVAMFSKESSRGMLTEQTLVMPRQGIRYVLWRGVLVGLLIWPMGFLVLALLLALGGLQIMAQLTRISESIALLVSPLVIGFTGGLTVGLVRGLLKGFSHEKLDEHTRIVPNQGIRRSARNSLRVGLPLGLAFGLVGGLAIIWSGSGLNAGLFFGLYCGLIIGSVVGLSFGLLNGGIACIQHIILRVLLWRSGSLPRNYPRFLDDAAERILLRKVGGGYIFVHRLLLEHFAARGTSLSSS